MRASALLLALPVVAAANSAASEPFSAVRTIFETRCLGCHHAAEPKGGLSLATAESARAGGDSGPAFEPGGPDESLILEKITGDPPKMPQQGDPLSSAEVAAVRAWIAAGADWPEGVRLEPPPTSGARWWSLQPLAKPEPPRLESTWVRTPIDAFILARLQREGLGPSAEADRRTLIRRLTFDLHGLPPTPEEVAAFLADAASDAYERLVDRLLASPRYGERWGRHWLDVVHFGESHGYDKDKPRLHAWPYRDYVIRSLNADKPYGRFLEEQLAGDVLRPDDPDGVVATGFIAAGPWDFVGHVELREGTKDKELTRANDRDDMVTTTASTFLSLTVHCARCHDHKFDPIPQQDYYRMQAVFAGIDRADRAYDPDPEVHQRRVALAAERRTLEERQRQLAVDRDRAADAVAADLKVAIARLEQEVAATDAGSPSADGKLAETLKQRQAELAARVDEAVGPDAALRFRELGQRLEDLNRRWQALPEPQLVYAAANGPSPQTSHPAPHRPRPIHLLVRGSVEAPGPLVGPGALRCVEGVAVEFPPLDSADEGARRAALAHWISDPGNPLTWRSIVNRAWHYHFDRGLVDTPNDFGRMGSPPTHPELLDWLAAWFLENGQSLKALHRLIVTSAVYRQASTENPEYAGLDGENRLLWRMNRRRLEAECVRDAALYVSGGLDLTMGGPSVQQFAFKDDHSPVYDYERFQVDAPDSRRRSVYRFLVRSVPDPLMERLDCPDPSFSAPKRNTTLTAIQALATLNNRFFVRQAERLAEFAAGRTEGLEGQTALAFEAALSRRPEPAELAALLAYAKCHGLANACRVILNSNEFVFVD
jgi:mono/diheme cytochrome c family protein